MRLIAEWLTIRPKLTYMMTQEKTVVERTLVLLKPDCVQRRLMARVLGRFEDKGLVVIALKLMRMTPALAKKHYAEHIAKSWYPPLEQYITASPVVAAVIEGPEAIRVVREMVGVTDSLKATPGTIRGDFGCSQRMNLVHASDGPESAQREIDIFFSADEIHAYTPTLQSWVRAEDEG